FACWPSCLLRHVCRRSWGGGRSRIYRLLRPNAGCGAASGKLPNGTFAEEFVGPEHCFTPIPEVVGAAPEILCRLGWFATALAGFRRGAFKPGMIVAINGAAGMLGTSAALVALAIGAAQIRLVGRRTAVLHSVAGLDKRFVVETPGDETPLD